MARYTAGFSGADLANLMNEAALLAVRREAQKVTMADFDQAIQRIVAGLDRGHAPRERPEKGVLPRGRPRPGSQLLPLTDTVHKVSIIPTSKGALGYTMEMPEEDRYLMSEDTLRQRLAVMLGGRAAELLVFQKTSTGASNDLERATSLANRMVTEFGMSEVSGPVRYAVPAGMGYLGAQAATQREPGNRAAHRRRGPAFPGRSARDRLRSPYHPPGRAARDRSGPSGG